MKKEKKRLVIATFNRDKYREYLELLSDLNIELIPLFKTSAKKEEFKEKGESFEENASIKAKLASKITSLPSFSDDSGLCVDILNGAPGVYSARYGGEPHNYKKNNERLLKELNGVEWNKRKAKFVCVIAFYEPEKDKIYLFRGECHGFITFEPKGEGGFGYDPLFYFPELGKTFAELSLEEKNKVSHRGRALSKFKKFLKEYWKV